MTRDLTFWPPIMLSSVYVQVSPRTVPLGTLAIVMFELSTP